MSQSKTTSLSSMIWQVADLLRGDFKPAEYGRIILPFTVLRRLDAVLAPTRDKVLKAKAQWDAKGIDPTPFMHKAAGLQFVNISDFTLQSVLGDTDNLTENLSAYIAGFSPSARDIFEHFRFAELAGRLAKADLLYLVLEKFVSFNLTPSEVDNHQMGLIFEELIRKFSEASNETAGEHFTPREVIRLMVNLIFAEDDDILSPGKPAVRTIYDPTAGTGGMLSVAEDFLREHNPKARLTMFGQELNPESYAICKADMLIKGQDVTKIKPGNTLSDDELAGMKFDYMLSNPPFGVEWKKVQKEVKAEHEKLGYDGRFGPGLPRISDGSMLFLLHLVSKMRPAKDGGSKFGIVLNGSPLFTGAAGSGESEIRRYVLERDLVEAIIALPTDMFFNTGIATYIWVLTNNKPKNRKGKVQLIDASSFWQKMRKSLGSKRKEMSEEDITLVTQLFSRAQDAQLATITKDDATETRTVVWQGERPPKMPKGATVKLAPLSRVLPNEAFGYQTITVERPERDAKGKVMLGQKGKAKGKPVPDSSLRDTENVPLNEDIHTYFKREVLPHAPDAWIDEDKTKIGYEIPFNRYFYVFEPPRPLAEIDADLKEVTSKIMTMLKELSA
ncbi:type I restriction-modification system subunit M [Acetobacter orientalis]|uniref:type I restriction-modification system subunit M n=1 Tax=Acetobacter orientalis TaxID=146474 RepID=UPI0020A2CE8D|nr:class I SAM-dependent DNA methyltransferase [Acetobacter orientalis]MCP1220448.1 type I restriction-modification system subunit M [Acetobacter orientalis]